jgi:hypothetical protein
MSQKATHLFLSIIAAVLIIGALWFVIADEPEEVLVISEDGILSLRGVARESQPFTITQEGPRDLMGDVGVVYHVEPDEIDLEAPVTIEMRLDHLENPDRYTPHRYNLDFHVWVTMNAEERDAYRFKTTSNRTGYISLLPYEEIDVPNFLTTQDALLELAPLGTVGFEMVSGAGEEGGPMIQTKGKVKLGGCGGQFKGGNRTETSTMRETAHVLMGDMDREIEFLFTARWQIDEGGGCEDSELLELAI